MADKKKLKSSENLQRRVILGVALLGAFITLIKTGSATLIVLVAVIGVLVFSEFLKVLLGVKRKDDVPVLGEFISTRHQLMPAGFFWACFVCLGVQKMSDALCLAGLPFWTTQYLPYLHIVWISWFILLLKGGMYRKKFFYGSIGVVWSLVVIHCTVSAVNNINRGVFYFVYACSLVFVNDTAAYVVGKLFGATPLIIISPNKTLEGFLGGGAVTVLVSFPLAYLIRAILQEEIGLSLFQLHVLSLTSAAIAPIGGLLASGYKRAFGVKHFGTLLPGHGGITDRVDCQLIMQVFTNVYLAHVNRAKTIEYFQVEIEQKLSKKETVSLILNLLENL